MSDKVFGMIKPIRKEVMQILEEANYPKSVKGITNKLLRMNVISKEDNITHPLTFWLNSNSMIMRVQTGKRKYRYTLKSKNEVE